MYVCIYTHLHIYICIYIYIYKDIHINIHIHFSTISGQILPSGPVREASHPLYATRSVY